MLTKRGRNPTATRPLFTRNVRQQVASLYNGGLYSIDGDVVFEDLSTQTVPAPVPGGDESTTVPNDGLGGATDISNPPTGLGDVYFPLLGQFSFTYFTIGDLFDLSIDLEITTTALAQIVEVDLVFGIGSSAEITLSFGSYTRPTIGTIDVLSTLACVISSSDILNYPAQIRMRSLSPCLVRVGSWRLHNFKRNRR